MNKEELDNHLLRALEFQHEIERSGAARLQNYKDEIATLLNNLKRNTAKKPKRGSNNESRSSTNLEGAQQKTRSATVAAKLKVPALDTKSVKQERISDETTSREGDNKIKSKENNPNTINLKVERSSVPTQKKSNERSSDPTNEESVIVVPLNKNAVVDLSADEENNDKILMMPPPAPKPKNPRINQATTSNANTRSMRKRVPRPIAEVKIEKLTDSTLESVYEDAVGGAMSLPVDSTFIQPSDQTITIQPLMAVDATFVAQNPTLTNGEPSNETFCVQTLPPHNDETVVLEKKTEMPKETSDSEYVSDDEISHLVQSKEPTNELIYPRKNRVEAVEALAPDVQRQQTTRTQTRANAAASNRGSSPKDMKAAKGNSVSKLAHINRTASASKLSQHSRENSVDDSKRGQSASSDKWRKRDEKLKHVNQQREALEKEKKEKIIKQMQEKEEKIRQEVEKKKLAKEKKEKEAETRRNLEEINRNFKVQEQKQKEEALRVEREQTDIRIAAEKKALQQRLKQNIVVAAKKKPTSSKYTFDMLNTDDETEDEAHPKPGRPTPPEWSLRGHVEERIASQSYLSSACVEALFPVYPMTINLQEVFPDINVKHLRRNSSALWQTPPRYSTMELPKYDA